MKYLVITEDSICYRLSQLLVPELERYDVRSEIKPCGKSGLLKELKVFDPDFMIIIGSSQSMGILQRIKKVNARKLFFYQSALDSKPGFKISKGLVDKIYFDLPDSKLNSGNGSLLADFVRKSDLGLSHGSGLSTNISIVATKLKKWHFKLGNELSKANDTYNFEYVELGSSFENSIIKVNQSNAVISTDQYSAIVASLVNCPIVNVYKKSLFSSSANRIALINSILNKEVVKSYDSKDLTGIKDELHRTLNDPNYSAGILNDFQEFKSKIGNKPFSREVAQEIVEWGESDLSSS